LYYTREKKASLRPNHVLHAYIYMNPHPTHDNPDEPAKDPGYVLHRRQGRTIQPMAGAASRPAAADDDQPSGSAPNPAAELIRRKLNQLYADEPSAATEATAASHTPAPVRSKHQQYMYELSTSGKSLAQIQTEWHAYYLALPDDEKHEVWQEFYATNARQPSAYTQYVQTHAERTAPTQPGTPQEPEGAAPAPAANPLELVAAQRSPIEEAFVSAHPPIAPAEAETPPASHAPQPPSPADRRSLADLKKQLLGKVRAREHAQLQAKHHLQSIAFGVGMGALVLFIFLFGFFNELVIAPFIQPSRHAGATPIILSTDGVAPSDTPEVIIPKTNVEIPVDYSETSIDNDAVEKSLESGVLHYPTTAVPGQQGNAAFFGHSSNNIFNKGKYKFAFVLLHELVPGDIFYLTYNKQVYSYRVYDKKIVPPSDVSVLGNVPGKTATATLITCDPPGTSLNRLVVWGEQVSPDPSGNAVATANTAATTPTQLANNGPTLWGRFTHWVGNLF